MDKLDEVALFNIAIKLNVPQLLNLCRSSKRFNDKICVREPIWLYLLNREFPKEKDQFGSLNLSQNLPQSNKSVKLGDKSILSERNYLTPKELFKLLYSLKTLKEKLNLKDSLFEFYNREFLDLSNNQLKEIPKEIGLLKNLQRLYLYHNQIEEIPKEIGLLKNLKYLSLYNNQLQEIPKEIGNLTNLVELYLDNNHLKEIPKEIGFLKKMHRLYLSNNWLKEIPKEIANLTNLNVLNLSNNQLKQMPQEIQDIKGLTIYK